MGKLEDERLQRYFDGELSAEERAEVEAALTDDDRLKLLALAEVRGLVANALAAEAADVDVWSAIAPALHPGGTGSGKAASRAARRWGLLTHPASWSAGFVTAAAAALLLILQPWHAAHAQNGCDVESLETDGAMASVIRMNDSPHSGDPGTTVIWTMEDD